MAKTLKFLLFISTAVVLNVNAASVKDPLTRTVYKYGLILDECTLDGKPLKKDSRGDWGYFITITEGVDFGSDIDSRWLRIEFQYFPETKHLEFTIYTSTVSRQGDWKELVGFQTNFDGKKMDFESADTWQTISFENERIKLKFRFYLLKVR